MLSDTIRLVNVVFADCAETTLADCQHAFPNKPWTLIDTTRDFNQTRWLGLELTDTIVHLNDKTRINAILSICGCVKGGSTIIFSLANNSSYRYFKNYILIPKLQQIARHSNTIAINKDNNQTVARADINNLQALDTPCRIIHLIGERGTGKTTLLGTYIQSLIEKQAKITIRLCSPSKKASANTLRFINHDVSRETFAYYSPEQLQDQATTCDLLVIDEASSLPKKIINEALTNQQNKKIILATTIDGYEGTGQTYRLAYINTQKHHIINLTQPRRYSYHDPLYQYFHKLCHPECRQHLNLLTAIAEGTQIIDNVIARQHHLTLPCFALLQAAHYRTTPNDLERFYDMPAQFAINTKHQRLMTAAYLLTEALEPADQNQARYQQIIHGTRRLKNAMTQQAIIHSYGNTDIAKAKIWRISRIATEQSYRRQHYASDLLTAIITQAEQQHIDYLSTSYSLKPNNLAFWLSQGFTPVRIGIQPNKWHHAFSLLMLRPISEPAKQQLALLKSYFYQHIHYFKTAYQSTDKPATTLLYQTMIQDNVVLPKLNRSALQQHLHSITDYHRDIHWVLPMIANYLSTQQTPVTKNPELKNLLNGRFIDKTARSNAKTTLQNVVLD